MKTQTLELERVRRHTPEAINERIDDEIAETVHAYADASEEELSARIAGLDSAWDIERVLETNASILALAGVGLSVTRDSKWLLLTTGVLGFLLLHGTQGWCPPLPALRRLGVRTRAEIDRERFVLKFLRGDFDDVRNSRGEINLTRLLRALARN
jgi:hypothetical protein